MIDHEPNDTIDLLFLAVRGQTVAGGFVFSYARDRNRRVDGAVLEHATSRAFGDPAYKGTGTVLMEAALAHFRKDRRIRWVFIRGPMEMGYGLYIKSGFKWVGRTRTMCYPIRSFITPARVRYFDEEAGLQSWLVRRDTRNHRIYQFCTPPDAEFLEEMSTERYKATLPDFHIYPLTALQSVRSWRSLRR